MTYQIPSNRKARPVSILGAGTLGRRIALMIAAHGAPAVIFDVKAEQAQAAIDYVKGELPKLLVETKKSAGQIRPASDLADAVRDAWLVIEAVPEHLDLKRDIFGKLDNIASADAILASNSSSYPSSQFIDQVSEEGRRRVLNTHFMMPPLDNAVELMSCGHTDPNVLGTLMEAMPEYGFVPFLVRKESVGLIFNRIWAAIKRERLNVVATGVATPEDVDRIFCLTMRCPAGPFRSMDMVGLDVVLHIEEHYQGLNPSLPKAPLGLLHEYIDRGWLGRKASRGFYDDYKK